MTAIVVVDFYAQAFLVREGVLHARVVLADSLLLEHQLIVDSVDLCDLLGKFIDLLKALDGAQPVVRHPLFVDHPVLLVEVWLVLPRDLHRLWHLHRHLSLSVSISVVLARLIHVVNVLFVFVLNVVAALVKAVVLEVEHRDPHLVVALDDMAGGATVSVDVLLAVQYHAS